MISNARGRGISKGHLRHLPASRWHARCAAFADHEGFQCHMGRRRELFHVSCIEVERQGWKTGYELIFDTQTEVLDPHRCTGACIPKPKPILEV